MSFKGEVGGAIDGDIAGLGFVAGTDVIEVKTAGVDAVEVEGGGFGAFERESDAIAIWGGRVGDAVVGFGVGGDAAIVDASGALIFDGDVVEVEVAVFG